MDKRVPLFSLDRENSTILRGIAILLVLLGHTGYFVWGGAGGVTLFLILSGYGLNTSCEKNGLERYWNKRIRKVWLPYAIIGLYVLVGWRIRSKRVIVCTLLGLDLGLIADKTMWYISFIMLWYMVYYILARLSRIIRGERGRAAFLLLGLFLASFAFRWLYDLGFWHAASGAGRYYLAFPLGVALSYLPRVKVKENTRLCFQLGLLFLSSAYMLGAYTKSYNVLMAMVMGIQPIAIVQSVRIGGRLEKLLLWFGKYSYPIYLFEGLFLYTRNQMFSQMLYQPLIDLTFMAVSTALAVIYWEGGYARLEKALPLDKLIRF